MWQKVCRFLIFKCARWKVEQAVEIADKCVICVAPHTSNWDFVLGKMAWTALGRKASFLMKKDWFVWPLGDFFKSLGGVPIDRGKHTRRTEQLIQLFNESDRLNLAITPEGTRKANPSWHKGFYYIALGAGVPILLIGIDYGTKTFYINRYVEPSGDYEADIRLIKDYFKDMKGKNPQNFKI